MIDKLIMYLNYPFVRYAFIVGILVALCSSLFGVVLVLKRYSFIGDGLSHVAFGAMTISTVLSIQNELPFVMLFTIIVAVIILNNKKIRGDAMIGMLSVGSLAIGYLLMNISGTSANVAGDVCSTLFGSTSILTLSISDVYLCVGLSIVVIVVFICLYNKIFSITFDEDFAKAVGVNVELYNLIFAIIIAIIIVLAMNLVGSLLISALVIFPSLSAMCIFKSFKGVTICAAFLAILCSSLGISISILASTPAGSTIVVVQIVVFILCNLIGLIRR